MMEPIGRRSALAGAIAMIMTGAAADVAPARTAPALLRSRLARMLGSRSGAFAIGNAYVALRPEETSPERLASAIVKGRPFPPAGRDGDRDLRDFVRAAIRDDFARGATVTLDGWTLSVTEARLCALATRA